MQIYKNQLCNNRLLNKLLDFLSRCQEYQNSLFGCHEQLHLPICLSHYYIVAIQSSLHGVDFHCVEDFGVTSA